MPLVSDFNSGTEQLSIGLFRCYRVQMAKRERDPVCEAVRTLRLALNENQQEFARRVEIALRTLARYEKDKPPRGKTLGKFARLALELGFNSQAAVFRAALEKEMGVPVSVPHVPKTTGVGFRFWTAEEEIWFKALEEVLDEVAKHGESLEFPDELRHIDGRTGIEHLSWTKHYKKVWEAVKKALKDPYLSVRHAVQLGDINDMRESAIFEWEAKGYSADQISKALNLEISYVHDVMRQKDVIMKLKKRVRGEKAE